MDNRIEDIVGDMINDAIIDLRAEFNEKIKTLSDALDKAVADIKTLSSQDS